MMRDIQTSPIVVDLETCGLPNAAEFLEPVTPDARLKDPDKIKADIEAKTEARQQKIALDWNVGRIAAIGWWTDEGGTEVRLCPNEDDEADALREFWSLSKHRTLVGYNLKGFDCKYMIQRSRYLDVPHPLLDIGKYSERGVIDLYYRLTFNEPQYDTGAMRRTLHAFCKRFGIPVDDTLSGKEMPAIIADGKWDEVIAHVTSDVNLTVALARKLRVVSYAPEREPAQVA